MPNTTLGTVNRLPLYFFSHSYKMIGIIPIYKPKIPAHRG